MTAPVLRRRLLAAGSAAIVVASLTWAVPATAAPPKPAAPVVPTALQTPTRMLATPTDCADIPARAATLARTIGSGTATCVRDRAGAPSTRSAPARVDAANAPCGSGTWIATRTTMCADGAFQLIVYTVPQGAIIGVIDFDVRAEVYLTGRSDRWDTYVRFTGRGGGGVIAGTTLNAVPLCGEMCSYLSNPGITTPFGPGTQAQGAASFSSRYGGPYVSWQASAHWQFTFSNTAWSPPVSNPMTVAPPAHRCDDALPGRPVGCTVAFVEPVHTISSAYPNYARHINLALNFGLPNRLTRTTDGNRNHANREAACRDPQGRPRPTGYECDEYPFASTYEGAASQPYGRTFNIIGGINGGGAGTFICGIPWLTNRQAGDSGGFSACFIPDWENRDAGAVLNLFYYDNRVIDRDIFRIRIG